MFLPGWTFLELKWSWVLMPFDFRLFIFHALQYSCLSTLIILLKHLHQSARENFWMHISAVSAPQLMQTYICKEQAVSQTVLLKLHSLLRVGTQRCVVGTAGRIHVFWKIIVRNYFVLFFIYIESAKKWPIMEVNSGKKCRRHLFDLIFFHWSENLLGDGCHTMF